MNFIGDLKEFHTAFNLTIGTDGVSRPALTPRARLVMTEACAMLEGLSSALAAEGAQCVLECDKDNLVRMQLIVEETAEVFRAVVEDDGPQILHEMVDLAYVVAGTAVTYGVDEALWARGWDLVHSANMAKLGKDGKPILNEAGRVVKPEGWTKADMKDVM